ncbi:MAG: hypothetical protein QT01_C0001G0040 [archaeon GW2011_AR6]|nr:MAG: hypothetical protein QT01_C0001G0040 [archaeon GW2011_AR6]
MVFIDGSNLYHILKGIYKNSVHLSNFKFSEFSRRLTEDRKLIRVYYYNAILNKQKDPEGYKSQQRFYEKLRTAPDFELTLCRLQKNIVDGETKYTIKEDDISIAVDMVKLAYNNAYDTAILVSTDGDFVPAVKAVKEKGKRVECVGFLKKFSWHLKQNCDRTIILDKADLDKCVI